MSVFEERVLRRIFRPNREEVTAGWGELDTEELTYLALNRYC